ncbi:RNA polymerase sigma factor [Paenibacillus sp. PR3]|uniref:RNA polymerase sigma factor n=1 Tax=Paenibacillus terricola TaxID=2763503 RepID=A0ABR8MNH9_9BACL|nr:RNA polymerase sigma factor [Paenibacillus terricola]MBD3917573.1 RNA polymerase sigma factor [Paenibacillus terricola]
MSGQHDNFETAIAPYYDRIRRYLSLRVDSQTAEDLTQVTFIRAFEHYESFRGESSPLTWLMRIANNTLKNEYRRKHRIKESAVPLDRLDSRFIAAEFTKNVEIRVDISQALASLNDIDREIIALHYDVGCTLLEVSEIVGKKLSAVKNRLYRALDTMRTVLREAGETNSDVLTFIEHIILRHAGGLSSKSSTHSDAKIRRDIVDHLNAHITRVCTLVRHEPSTRISIEIYPDLPTFHEAVGEHDAPDWFMGTIESNTIKIASPLHPGPAHTYESILKSTVHLFTMWLVQDRNPAAPKWLYQGVGGYAAELMTRSYINAMITDPVQRGQFPTFADFEDHSWDFETKRGFEFSCTLAEFILERYGTGALHAIIANPQSFERTFRCSAEELHRQWRDMLAARISEIS